MSPQKNNEIMNFLNEISSRYPNAISFASGRPTEKYFSLQSWVEKLPVFIDHFASATGVPREKAWTLVGQYGKTNGIINDLIAEQLKLDEGLNCTPEQIIVTAGCQEAMALCLQMLLGEERDVLLVFNPSYIGATGVAEVFDKNLASFSVDDTGDLLESISLAITKVDAEGRRVRAIYLVADFNNPTGEVLSEDQRRRLIDFCAERRIFILEDNAYGMFRYEGVAQRTLYSLDTTGVVLYLGTYSKSLCPALRVGFVVLPPLVFGERKNSEELNRSISIAKSFVTLNTSQVSQAIVGGILLSERMSLRSLTQSSLAYYKNNRDSMIAALENRFSGGGKGVSWNRPEGGFFLVVNLPFEFGDEDAKVCAEDFNVLCMPMSFFAFSDKFNDQIRLAFSNVENGRIEEGINSFATYVEWKLG